MSVSTASAVIDFVERLIDDEDNDHHSALEIYDVLNRYRLWADYVKLVPVRTRAAGTGTVTYTIFEAPGDWHYFENDAAVYDSDFDELTPDTEDFINGRWTFSSEPDRPVTVRGWSHDPYAAAAELLETRGSQLAEDVQSFSTLNGSVAFASKRRGPLELAQTYWRKSRAGTGATRLERSDLAPSNWPSNW